MARWLPSIVLLWPIEAAPEDAFHDPVIGGCSGSYAHAKIDLPLGRHVQIDHRKDLLLLVVQAGDIDDVAIVGVVLKPAADLPGEVVADLDRRRELYALVHIRSVPGAFERRVDRPVPPAAGLIDDRTDLPRPGIVRKK